MQASWHSEVALTVRGGGITAGEAHAQDSELGRGGRRGMPDSSSVVEDVVRPSGEETPGGRHGDSRR